MKTGCDRRLDKSFLNAPVIALTPHSRIVLISDCHRGAGNSNDNFLKNQHLYFAALRHYYTNGFTYIELGDGDELWENRSLAVIQEIHGNVFWLLSLFEKERRLYQLYGNHDHVLKKCKNYPHYAGLKNQSRNEIVSVVYPHYAGLILKSDCGSGNTPRCLELYLTHGHQADLLNSTLWRLARFLVRYLWKPLEQSGVLDPTSAAKNYRRRSRSEKRLVHWAVKNGRYLITGHTHRPTLGDRQTRYFNTGSCVHPRCITCLEIEHSAILLVKWSMEPRPDNSLYVARSVLAGPLALKDL